MYDSSNEEEQKEQRREWADELRNAGNTMRAEFHQEFHVSKRRHNSGWIIGVILVIAGGLLLAQNLLHFQLYNWWALFILIPAFGSFADALNRYRDSGRFSRHVRNAVIGGLIFLFIALFFLFNFAIGSFLPYLLILGGIVILLNALLPD